MPGRPAEPGSPLQFAALRRLRASFVVAAAVALVATFAVPAPHPVAASSGCTQIASNTETTTYSCGPGPSVSINDARPAYPYPSTLIVNGISGIITDLDVQLTGLTHPRPDDIDMMLSGPSGTASILMSDAGGNAGVTAISMTIDDDPNPASPDPNHPLPLYPPVPDTLPLGSGTYGSADYATWGDTSDPFVSPAPAHAAATLGTFNGIDPLGAWRLFIVDDESVFSGSLDEWRLIVTVRNPATPVPEPEFDLIHALVAPPALLTIADGDRYLVRDPASLYRTEPDVDTAGERNLPARYDDMAALAGSPRSIARGDWDHNDTIPHPMDGQEVLVVNDDGSAVLLDDASADVTDASAGRYRVLHEWPSSTGVVAGTFMNWDDWNGEGIVLVTNTPAEGWKLRLYNDANGALGVPANGQLAAVPLPREEVSTHRLDYRVLDITGVPGDPHALVLAEAYRADATHDWLTVTHVEISVWDHTQLEIGFGDSLSPGYDPVLVEGGVVSADVAMSGFASIGGGKVAGLALAWSTTASTATQVMSAWVTSLDWPADGTWTVTPVSSPVDVQIVPQVRSTPASVTVMLGLDPRDPLWYYHAMTVGCASTTAEAGGESLALETWQYSYQSPTEVVPQRQVLTEVKGEIRDATTHVLLRNADQSGHAVTPSTVLWEVGFRSTEAPGRTKVRVAGIEQAMVADGTPDTATGTLTPVQVIDTGGAIGAYVMTPVDLKAPTVTLERARDEFGNVIPMQSVALTPIPQILLPAPPQVRGLGQEPSSAPTYTTGTSSGTGTGHSHEVSVGVIAGVNTEEYFSKAGGIEFTVTVSEAFGWSEETNSTTQIEDFYVGSAEEDAVIVNRTTMWSVPYRIVSSTDGLGIGATVELRAPRSTVLAVDTVGRLRTEAPELFDGRVMSEAEWRAALPHTVGLPSTYPEPGAEVATYCDGGGQAVESLRHEVDEGNSLTEGARVTMSEEHTTTQTRTTSVEVELVKKFVFLRLGVSFSYSYGQSWTTTLGTQSSFEGSVGSVPYRIDGWDESYGWGLFVCKRQLGSFPVWSANYSVGSPPYTGRGSYAALGPVRIVAPAADETVPLRPTYEWTGGGSVRAYQVEVEQLGGTGGFMAEVPVPLSRADVAGDAVQSWTPPDNPGYSLTYGASYRWRVHAYGFLGNEEVSGWSTLATTNGPNDFSITAAPSSLSVAQGATTTLTVSTAIASGAAQTVALSVTGQPAGVTAAVAPESVAAGDTATVTVAAASGTAPGTYPLTITGTGATATHSAVVDLTVTATNVLVNGDFELGTLSGWAATGTTSITTAGVHGGAYAARTGSTTPTTGDSSISQAFAVPSSGGTLRFWYMPRCSGLASLSWVTATLRDTTTGATRTLLAPSCATGPWTRVEASLAPHAGHVVALTLTSHATASGRRGVVGTYATWDDVTFIPAPVANDFSIRAAPSTVSIARGSSGSTGITTAVVSGSAESVALSVTGLPTGVTAAFSPASVAAGAGSTLTLTVASGAAAGSYPLTVTGTSASATHGTPLTLAVTAPVGNDFSLLATPTAVSIARGSFDRITVSSAVVSGSAEHVELTVTGLPDGMSYGLAPTGFMAGGGSTVTLDVFPEAATGTTTIAIVGTSPSVTHTIPITLTVTAGNDFAMFATPSGLSVVQGGTGTSTISTQVVSGSAGFIHFNVENAPSGVTAAFAPDPLTTGGSAVLTLAVAATAAPGTYPLSVVGMSPPARHTITVSLTVTAPVENLIVNGGFEAGGAMWTRATTRNGEPVPGTPHVTFVSNPVHGGGWAARTGDPIMSFDELDSLSQAFDVPASGATLTLWYLPSCSGRTDWVSVMLRDETTGTTTAILPRTCRTAGWTPLTASLNANAGHSVTLTLASNVGGGHTWAAWDDVLVVANPAGRRTGGTTEAGSATAQATPAVARMRRGSTV